MSRIDAPLALVIDAVETGIAGVATVLLLAALAESAKKAKKSQSIIRKIEMSSITYSR